MGGNRVPGSDDSAEIVRLLDAWRTGDREAYDRLFSLVYSELHRLASGKLGRETQAYSLQPTLLVHEVYMRMADVGVPLTDRGHFLAIAARVMRHILVDMARQRRAQKRGGDEIRVELTEELATSAQDPVDILSLHLAIERLQAHEPRSADVIELSYFGGLTNAEIGQMLGISPATVDRDLRHARAWLKRELTSTGAHD